MKMPEIPQILYVLITGGDVSECSKAKSAIKSHYQGRERVREEGGDRFYQCNDNQIDYLQGVLASRLVIHDIAFSFNWS